MRRTQELGGDRDVLETISIEHIPEVGDRSSALDLPAGLDSLERGVGLAAGHERQVLLEPEQGRSDPSRGQEEGRHAQRDTRISDIGAHAEPSPRGDSRPQEAAQLAVDLDPAAPVVVVVQQVAGPKAVTLFEGDRYRGRVVLGHRGCRSREEAQVQEPSLEFRHLARVERVARRQLDLLAHQALPRVPQAAQHDCSHGDALSFGHLEHQVDVRAPRVEARVDAHAGIAQAEVVAPHSVHRGDGPRGVVLGAGLDPRCADEISIPQRGAFEPYREKARARPFANRHRDGDTRIALHAGRLRLGAEVERGLVRGHYATKGGLGVREQAAGASRGVQQPRGRSARAPGKVTSA